jgi:RNA polymerase sigma-70 factor (ECF subfamily)
MLTDEELMLDAKAGRQESFGLLMSRHRAVVIRFIMRMHPDLDLAEDVCQEAWMRIWLHRERYTASGAFTTYLFQIAKRILLNRLRDAKIGIQTDIGESIECTDQRSVFAPEYMLLENSKRATIECAIDRLPITLAGVFRAVAIEGMTYTEAAETLDIPIGTVKWRMHEAVMRLRSMLIEEELS